MKNVLRADNFIDRKIQFIQLKPNKKFIGNADNMSYPNLVAFLETKFLRDKYIKYKGGLYFIDQEEVSLRLNRSKSYRKRKLQELIKNKNIAYVPKDLYMHFVDQRDLPQKEFIYLLDNKNADEKDLNEFKKWKNYKFFTGKFEDRKLFDIEIKYIDTSIDDRFSIPLYTQYKRVASKGQKEIVNFVEKWGKEFCLRTDQIEEEFFNRYLNKSFDGLLKEKRFKRIKDFFVRFLLINGIFKQILDSYYKNNLDSFEQDLVNNFASNVKILNIKEKYSQIWKEDQIYSNANNEVKMLSLNAKTFLDENIYRVYNWKDYVYLELQELFIKTKKCRNCGYPLPLYIKDKIYKGKYCPKGSKNYSLCSKERNRKRQKEYYKLTKT